MKRIFYVITFSAFFIVSCSGYKTVSTGLENEAFLEFIGKPSKYRGGVDVILDDKINFKAYVNKDHADRPKGNVYSVSTGNHTLKVSFKNEVLVNKQIFVSSQETKKTILP